MSRYYRELVTFLTEHCHIDLSEKIIYSNYYLKINDYVITVSEQDRIKNILSLLKSLPTTKDVKMYLRETIAIIIAEVLRGHDHYLHLYAHRLKLFIG